MLCSKCKKNAAIIFTNKIENGKTVVEGFFMNVQKEWA